MMLAAECSVMVARDVEDLIPTFLNNRRNELNTLREALERQNFEQLTYVGNRMIGCGIPYGFDRVSYLGQHISQGAQAKNTELLAYTIAEYETFLSNLHVSFHD